MRVKLEVFVPDPVSSATPNPALNQCLEDDASEALPPTATEAPNAVWSLVQQFPAASFSTPSPASGQRSDATSVVGYDYSGPTPEGDSQRSEAAFVKSSNPSGALNGSSIEVLGAVAQTGKQDNHELVALRSTLSISHAGFGLAVMGDGPSARQPG